MNLHLETNPRNCLDINLQLPSGAFLMITPPAIDDRWLFRVTLAENLALLAVPQFGGVDIRLLSTPSSDASVPYETNARKIMDNFRDHAGNSKSTTRWLNAIQKLKAAVRKWRCGTNRRASPTSGKRIQP